MTDSYDCYQNALAERINGILKTEFLLRRPADPQQAMQMAQESVLIYNEARPRQALTEIILHRCQPMKEGSFSLSCSDKDVSTNPS